ncbi:MAG TPA: S46 family peptidase [Pyrinomonadaceae bacterium]|nr:S46 family peptidase [Pyrinomonadaceae bacterium]
MKTRRILCGALASLLLLTTLGTPALADEGMWTFNNLPRAEIKKRYGFEVTDDWVRRVQSATVRFPNGTGSFVSPEGLVLTNYHIVEDIVGELSTAEKDLAKTGFVAHTREEELKIPGLALDQLVRIDDVTARVTGAVKQGMSDADAAAARAAEMGRIESESAAAGMRADVVTLYQGGMYNLYVYRRYTDVRLVFAPEFQAAFFGGDPDNFNFPRYDLDMSLVRVYDGGKPLRPENYFKWSKQGPKEHELTFVSGSPGTTQRLNTVAHLEFLRDSGIPVLIRILESRRDSLRKYMAGGEEQTRRGQNELNYAENFTKVYKGQLEGLRDPKLVARKTADEQALRKYVSADARRGKEYGDAWDAIAKARGSLAAYEVDRRMLGGLTLTDYAMSGFNTVLFNYARTLVRLAEEDSKPDAERLPEYTKARRPALEAMLFSEAPIYDDFEQAKLAASLTLMRELYAGRKLPAVSLLNGPPPGARVAALIKATKLKDVAYRRELAAGGKKAVDASDDPLIVLARSVDAESRQLRARYETEVIGAERTAYGKIARALFEKEGTGLYPDATFTPRLSYGAVEGYVEGGKRVEPFTYYSGLYARSAEHAGKFPYNLATRWAEKKSAVDVKVPFNFVTTNDIIGGNSGSPTFNREMELVGLIFDGNIQSLVGNFYYDPAVNRAVSVDSRGMLEALRKVYGATEVADELAR